MLGIEKTNIVIKEPFVSQIREKLKRYRNNDLTEEELKQIEKSKKNLKKYNVIWVDFSLPIIYNIIFYQGLY